RRGGRYAPELASGDLVRAGRRARVEIRQLERAFDRGLPVMAADPVQVREDEQVLFDGQRDVEVVELRHYTALRAGLLRVLRQPVAEYLELALVGDGLGREHAHGRRLACAIWAEQPDARPDRDVEVETVDGRDRAVPLDGPAQADGELIGHAPRMPARSGGGHRVVPETE